MTRTPELSLVLLLCAATVLTVGPTNWATAQQSMKVSHKTVKIGDLDIFYREAGPKNAPRLPDQLARGGDDGRGRDGHAVDERLIPGSNQSCRAI
jgi:hypothetical protein